MKRLSRRQSNRAEIASEEKSAPASDGVVNSAQTAAEAEQAVIVCGENEGNEGLQKSGAQPKEPLKFFGAEVVYLAILGIGMAMVGWVAENIVKAATDGIIDCRFHTLPFISPYALIPFAFAAAFKSADDITIFGKKVFRKGTARTKILSNILTYAIICSAVFLGELAVGNMWEKFFGVQLWDYSGLPLQVTRYAGLIPSLGYGTGAYLLFRFAYGPLLDLLRRKADYKKAKIVAIVLGSAIVLDTLIMAIHIFVTGQPPLLWRIYL